MYIILPSQIGGLMEVISRIDASNFYHAQILMSIKEVDVSLPKFKFSDAVEFNDILKDVTTRNAFFVTRIVLTLVSFLARNSSSFYETSVASTAGTRNSGSRSLASIKYLTKDRHRSQRKRKHII